MEEKDRKALLQFKKEKSEKNCVHEKEMAAMYFQFMTQWAFERNMLAVPLFLVSPTMHYVNRNSGFHYILAANMQLHTAHLKLLAHFQVVQLRHRKLLMSIITFREFHNKVERTYV